MRESYLTLRNVSLCILLAAVGFVALAPLPRAQDMAGEAIWTFDSDWPVSHVETAELNGDNIPDAIVAEYSNDYYDEQHLVAAIDGATGDTLWTYIIQDGARSMTIGDINNDGVMDAVVGASYAGSGTPDGSVHAINGVDGTSLWVYPVNSTTQTVCVGDFNGDPYPDVAAGCFDDYVYAIDGETGTMLWRHEVGGLWINAVDAGDVNNDGIDDVAFAHEYLAGFDNYYGVLNGSNGNVIWDSTVTSVMLDAMIEDIDNDGDPEAIFAGISDADQGRLIVLGGLDGEPEWSYILGSIDHTNGKLGLHTYDIDDDLDLDLLISNSLGWRRILAFDGTVGTLMYQSDSLDGFPTDLSFGDITGDENLEIAAAAYDRVQVVSASTGELIWYYAVDGVINAVSCADLDDDKIVDVVAGGSAAASGWPPNPGQTVWGIRTAQSPLLWEFNFGEYGNAMRVADLNGDGFDDVIVVASLGDWVWVIDGATGEMQWSWTGTENLYAVAVGDFNNDLQPDVVVAGNDDMVTALDGSDGSLLWQATDPGDQIYRKCLQAADLNGDDFCDVIVGSDDGTIYAYSGVTRGADLLWSRSFTGGDAEEVELAEMNGVPPIDVVAIVGGKMVVLNGENGNTLWEYSTGTASARHCEVMDANDDGTPDVAIGVNTSPAQLIMVDGDLHTPIWTVPSFYLTYEYGLSHARINGDKADDLLAGGNSTSKTVHAFDGLTGAELWSFATNGEINCVLGHDLNGDEQDDVLAGSDDGHVYAIDGATGQAYLDHATTGDVMHLGVGDISNDGASNLACLTFDSDGIAYAFRSLYTAGCCNLVGDIDHSGYGPDISDLIYMVTYMFQSGAEPECIEEADINGDGSPTPDIADLVQLVGYMFQSGQEPSPCPY